MRENRVAGSEAAGAFLICGLHIRFKEYKIGREKTGKSVFSLFWFIGVKGNRYLHVLLCGGGTHLSAYFLRLQSDRRSYRYASFLTLKAEKIFNAVDLDISVSVH